jgi:hypothetical protein
MKKNLINVGRQNVKTRRRALPEKDEPEECWPFWEKLITDFLNLKTAWDSNSTLYMHHFDSVRFDMPNSFVDHIYTYVWVQGKVNNGKEKVQLAFSFGLVAEKGGKNLAFDAKCTYYYQGKFEIVGAWKVRYEDWDGYKPKVGGKPAIKSMCETYNRWVKAFKEWSKAIGSPTMKNYGLPIFAWETCNNIFPGMLKKSQTQIGRQNVKTKRSPLPEKDDHKCRDKIVELLIEMEEVSEWITGESHDYVGWFKSTEYWNIPDEDWCEFIDTVSLEYDEHRFGKNDDGSDREVEETFTLVGDMRSNAMSIQFILSQDNDTDFGGGYDLETELVFNRTGMNPNATIRKNMDYRKHNLFIRVDGRLEYDYRMWNLFKVILQSKMIALDGRVRLIFDKVGMRADYKIRPTTTFPDSLNQVKFK